MGGGGVLLAAGEMGDTQTSAIALAPWLGNHNPAYSNIAKPTLILGSEDDELAYYSEDYYNMLPDVERALAIWAGASHFDWYGDEADEVEIKSQFRTLVTAFLEVQLKGNTAAYSYFEGTEHAEHMDAQWFSAYDFEKK